MVEVHATMSFKVVQAAFLIFSIADETILPIDVSLRLLCSFAWQLKLCSVHYFSISDILLFLREVIDF